MLALVALLVICRLPVALLAAVGANFTAIVADVPQPGLMAVLLRSG